MYVVVGIALSASMAIVAMTGARRHRANRVDEAQPAPSVVLSVRPDRTAVVTLGVNSDASSAAVAQLVDAAVRHALTLANVDHIEIRRSNGNLVDRRRRNGLAGPGTTADAPDPWPL